ncbi:MAG TPA: AMP-binding protein [Myxococcaceae bacterium]|nr:AMP-binding protein [Myxococcaceae bacterium]
MDIGSLIPRHARYRRNHTGVICGDERLTWEQFHARVNRCANALHGLGVNKGDRVATVLPNRLELLDVYWACARLGAILVPLSPLLEAPGLRTLLSDSAPAVVVTNPKLEPMLAEVRQALGAQAWRHTVVVDAPVAGGLRYSELFSAASASEPPPSGIQGPELYNICYSSGTTGLPKGITHSHDVRAHYGTLFGAAYRMTPESVVYHSGSIVFNGAFLTLMPAFFLGGTYVLDHAFSPERFLQRVQREKVTHVMLVPSQLIAILGAPGCSAEALSSLEMLCTVGAPLPLPYKEQVHALLPGRVYELYGLTEGFVTILDKHDYGRKTASVGSCPQFSELRIVDDQGRELPPGEPGEVVGRSPILMPGYYNKPEATAQAIRDGWLYSGDLGYVDEDGYLYLVDRKKDLIITGGVNVYPRDIEDVLHQHPAILEAAVFGANDEKWGETPVAAVVLRSGQPRDRDGIQAWVNARVGAKYQRVTDVLFLDALPRNVAGKTLKRELRADYEAARRPKA